MIKKKYVNAFVIAATLAVPFSGIMAPIAKAEAAVEMKAASKLADGTYDVILKTYKDQTNDTSVASTYLKNPKVTIQGDKKIVTLTVQDSSYFQYLRVEDPNKIGTFHDVKVISEDKANNGTKVVQFEIGEFSKKYNMQMHILIPAIKYDHKYQLQFEIDASAIEQKPKFSDVPTWAQESVQYLVDKEAVHGKPDGTFAPAENIDRSSAAKILATVLGLEIKKDAKPSFPDAQNHWATPYIAAVEKAGIVKGDESGNFNPNGMINRASMATMLVNAYKLERNENMKLPKEFADLKNHWGAKYANILIQENISVGTDNGWAPDKAVSRAEAAQFIAKTDKLKK
ncbi:S-layer homology domain-containing protein [Bacillus mobilis]|uniref:S-layer homology domain-containing protein n=1 Tax=Bacillus mobilis TaxID=2026190 RepID=UPI002E24A30F|nr:S-layer homology domain-containing protein [Bacillus mobilis]